jgi:hypothetical protein
MSGPIGACRPASPSCLCRWSRSGASGPRCCRCFVPWRTKRCKPGALVALGTHSPRGRSGSSASPCAAATLPWAGTACTPSILTRVSGRAPLRGLSCPSAELVLGCPRLPVELSLWLTCVGGSRACLVWVCLVWLAIVCDWPRHLRLLAPMLSGVSLVPLCNNIVTKETRKKRPASRRKDTSATAHTRHKACLREPNKKLKKQNLIRGAKQASTMWSEAKICVQDRRVNMHRAQCMHSAQPACSNKLEFMCG